MDLSFLPMMMYYTFALGFAACYEAFHTVKIKAQEVFLFG